MEKGRHHWMEYFEQMKPGAEGNYRLFQECHPHSHEVLALQRETWSSSNIYYQNTLTQVYQIFNIVIIVLRSKIGFCIYVIPFDSHWIYTIDRKETVHKLYWMLNYSLKTGTIRNHHYLTWFTFKCTFHTHQIQTNIKQEGPVRGNLAYNMVAG